MRRNEARCLRSRKRGIRCGLAWLLSTALIAACSGGEGSDATKAGSPAIDPDPGGAARGADALDSEIAVISVEGMGEISIELLAGKAPKTVENFKQLVRAGFYDGTTFHRVIPGFMIQGGDPNTRDRDPRNDGQGGPGYTLAAEFNDTQHVRGIVSMARKGAPDSAGSQFFILVDDAPHLDGQYTAFGRVVSGIEVADRIVALPRDRYGRHGPLDRPLDDVAMTVRLEPGGTPAGE